MIPSTVEELTPAWFSEVLDAAVTDVEVLDAHSGTTGRARVRVSAPEAIPDTLFVKLQPFLPEQQEFLRMVGLGVAEARFYAAVGNTLPVRVPGVWHASVDESDDSFIMVLEDLEASGCRFPGVNDEDVLDVAVSLIDELALLHATYWNDDLAWLKVAAGYRRTGQGSKAAARGAAIVQSALDQFADTMPPEFGQLGELYVTHHADIVPLYGEGDRTLVHGDDHIGNLFVDGARTGFYDWAVVDAPSGHAGRRVLPLQLAADGGSPQRGRRAAGPVPRRALPSAASPSTTAPRTTSTGCSPSTRGSAPRRLPRWGRGGSRSRSGRARWCARPKRSRTSTPSAFSPNGSARADAAPRAVRA